MGEGLLEATMLRFWSGVLLRCLHCDPAIRCVLTKFNLGTKEDQIRKTLLYKFSLINYS